MSDIPYEFYQQLKHNKLRRAEWHDYRAKCFYLITLIKNPSGRIPLFSNLIRKGDSISTDFTWAGWGIHNGIEKFKRNSDIVKIRRYVIMPDHVHIIMEATGQLEMHLGYYVGLLKQQCTLCFQSKSKVYGFIEDPVFINGFNDRILMHRGQLDNWAGYILDNPRRLWLMRSMPDFFFKASVVRSDKFTASLGLDPAKPLIQLYGNRLLLDYPEICPVRFSRKFSAEEWQKRKKECLRVAKNGGVLISPFIHKEEKAILEEGLLLGAKVIKVIADGFLDREKPQGADFYHCAEGRMLFAAMNAGTFTKTPISRDLCRRMNDLTVWIAENRGELYASAPSGR